MLITDLSKEELSQIIKRPNFCDFVSGCKKASEKCLTCKQEFIDTHFKYTDEINEKINIKKGT